MAKVFLGGVQRELADEYAPLNDSPILSALWSYIDRRVVPGHFLLAVMENNCLGAVAHADRESGENLVLLVRYVYNEAPSQCWGSPDHVSRWLGGDDAAE